jgi:transcription initiation factor TFIIE subunit alpha
VDGFIETQKKKALERLRSRLSYENEHEFYSCGTQTCKKLTFEEAMEAFFKCPTCGNNLNLVDNSEFKEALQWKIGQMEQETRIR